VESSDEDELLQYREKVLAELERRAIRLREIEQQVAQLQSAIDQSTRGRKVFMGGAARIQVEAAHRAKLKEELRGLYREKEIAVGDLQKAEMRLQEVDLQLDELRGDDNEEQ